MTKYQSGADALNALNQEEGGGNGAEFSPFKSGTTYVVKVLGTADLISFFSYGIYKQLNSFVAANPSKKSAKGFPVENLTPFDKAWKFHKDQSEDFSDKHGQEASKYRAKQRFAMGFFDLDSGEQIIIDVSKAQAQAIHASIKKYEKKIGKIAFELSKEGSGTNTTVSLTPVLDMDEDLTDKQRENFDKAPESFDANLFDGILFEKDEAQMVEALHSVGFDVTQIGFSVPGGGDSAASNGDSSEAQPINDGEISDSELPF